MHIRTAHGFTLIEAVVVVAIMSVLLAVGMPSMSDWLLGRKAMAAAVFYRDGFALARGTAISHSAHSRLVMSDNTANGKLDWRVDVCFPVKDVVCDDQDKNETAWSTASADAPNDPDTAQAFRSIVRSAEALPDGDTLQQTVTPSGAHEIYFTPLGWVDRTVGTRVERIDLQPSLTRPAAFKPLSVFMTLSGIAVICEKGVAAADVRGCPIP